MSRVTGEYRSLFKIWVLIKCSTGNKFHTQTPEHRNRNSTPEKGEMRIYQVAQESAFHALENVLAASISGRVQRENTFYLPKGTLLFMTRVVYECREVHFVSAYGDPLKAPLQWKIDRKWKQKTARWMLFTRNNWRTRDSFTIFYQATKEHLFRFSNVSQHNGKHSCPPHVWLIDSNNLYEPRIELDSSVCI